MRHRIGAFFLPANRTIGSICALHIELLVVSSVHRQHAQRCQVKEMFRQPGDKGKQEGIIMVHQHYGTQTVNRGAVLPGMLVKHKDSTWTASANKRGKLYLHRGIERTYTTDLLVEVFLNGVGNGLSH